MVVIFKYCLYPILFEKRNPRFTNSFANLIPKAPYRWIGRNMIYSNFVRMIVPFLQRVLEPFCLIPGILKFDSVAGNISKLEAKIGGIMLAIFTLSGRCAVCPPYTRRPTWRREY